MTFITSDFVTFTFALLASLGFQRLCNVVVGVKKRLKRDSYYLVFVHFLSYKLINPSENFIMPFQTKWEIKVTNFFSDDIFISDLPISRFQHPMILIGENHQPTRYS